MKQIGKVGVICTLGFVVAACGGGSDDSSAAIQESGSVVPLESVTVPAGSFMALKLTTTERWTDSSGQNVTEQITQWADPAHWPFTIKTHVAYTRGGNVPAHDVNSQTIGESSALGSSPLSSPLVC